MKMTLQGFFGKARTLSYQVRSNDLNNVISCNTWYVFYCSTLRAWIVSPIINTLVLIGTEIAPNYVEAAGTTWLRTLFGTAHFS